MEKNEFQAELKKYIDEHYSLYGNGNYAGTDLLRMFKESKFFDKDTMQKVEFISVFNFKQHLIDIGLEYRDCGCGTIGTFRQK